MKKLEVAERLFNSGDYEDAVSRAYYAVYHMTQALLLTEGKGQKPIRDLLPFLVFSL